MNTFHKSLLSAHFVCCVGVLSLFGDMLLRVILAGDPPKIAAMAAITVGVAWTIRKWTRFLVADIRREEELLELSRRLGELRIVRRVDVEV